MVSSDDVLPAQHGKAEYEAGSNQQCNWYHGVFAISDSPCASGQSAQRNRLNAQKSLTEFQARLESTAW